MNIGDKVYLKENWDDYNSVYKKGDFHHADSSLNMSDRMVDLIKDKECTITRFHELYDTLFRINNGKYWYHENWFRSADFLEEDLFLI